MAQSIKYIASIDTSSANPDGTIAEDAPLILDAIPNSVIYNYSTEISEAIDFLLLRVNVNKNSGINSLEGRDLLCFKLFDKKPADDVETYQANSIDFNFDGEANIDGQQFWIQFLTEQPTEFEINVLKQMAEIKSFPDASKENCIKLLKHIHTPRISVGVYDVGQANFCSIVDQNEHPLVFFDLGWPVCFNRKSNPRMRSFDPFALDDLCAPAPVILSHLDWDHWAYAYQSGMARWDEVKGYWKSEIKFRELAINRPWLIRRPDYDRHRLGASHINLIQTLSKHTALYIWPDKLNEIHFGSLTVFKCMPEEKTETRPAFLRNNESLAILVKDKISNAKVLLCGDADYTSIPARYLRNLTGIVAPHHGGKTTPCKMPNALGHGRMVLSTYPECYSNVPAEDVENEAKSQGWDVFKTSDRDACVNNSSCITGNKFIRLSTSPRCRCGTVDRSCLCLFQV